MTTVVAPGLTAAPLDVVLRVTGTVSAVSPVRSATVRTGKARVLPEAVPAVYRRLFADIGGVP